MNGCPGIGGSLGHCAFCGKAFMREILMNEKIPCFSIDQVQGSLYAHRACIDKYEAFETILEWPEESPVRQAIIKRNAEIDSVSPMSNPAAA